MHEFEIALRLIVIGQVLLITVILLFGSGSKSARISGALLLLSVAAYLITSNSVLNQSTSVLFPLISLFSFALPYFLWTFAKCVFDLPLPSAWLIGFFVAIGIFVWVVFLADPSGTDPLMVFAYNVSRVASVIIVANALWVSAAGRVDDLLEPRRRFRMIFVALVSMLAIAVMLVELAIGPNTPSGWLTMLNVVVIGALTMGLAVPMLKLNEDLIPTRSKLCGVEPEDPPVSLGAADRVLHDRLTSAMESGSFRQTGLTIRSLADELGYPEHHLRRLINRHLGYRNFSAFLNGYRIGEAKGRLADPQHARTPVLTIALDLGYGSLGPFNRAFKAMTEMTPTEFRERAIPADSK